MPLKYVTSFLHQNKKNIINSFFYFGGSIVQLFISFFSQPIYARYLSAEEFGILGYYNSLGGFLAPLYIFGMTQYFMMNFFKQDKEENKILLFNIISYLAIINIIFSIIIFFVFKLGFNFFNITVPLYPFSVLIIIIKYFGIFGLFLQINLRMQKKAKNYFYFSLISPIANVVLGLSFVVLLNLGAEGKMLGQVFTNILLGGISLFLLRKNLTFKIQIGKIKKAFRFVVPIVVSGYAYFPIMNIDKLYLERLNNLSELGFYSIGSNAAKYLLMAVTAIFIAFEPDIYKSIAEKKTKLLNKNKYQYMLLVLVLVVAFMLISPYLLEFLTSGRYTRAYKYANLFVIGILFYRLTTYMETILIALDRPKYILYVNLIGGISALIVYKIMIGIFAFIGASISYILVAIIMSISAIFLTNNAMRMSKKLEKNNLRRDNK